MPRGYSSYTGSPANLASLEKARRKLKQMRKAAKSKTGRRKVKKATVYTPRTDDRSTPSQKRRDRKAMRDAVMHGFEQSAAGRKLRGKPRTMAIYMVVADWLVDRLLTRRFTD